MHLLSVAAAPCASGENPQLTSRGAKVKYFSFRFDVDTPLCIQKGMPNLIRLAEKMDVKFTFFVNMGRSVSHLDYIKKILRKTHNKRQSSAPKLSNVEKLGVAGFLSTAILNSYVGKAHPEIIRWAQEEGHEIGLHGGRNHASWQNHASEWPRERVEEEIDFGLKELDKIGIAKPTLFASPGWQGNEILYDVLISRGFKAVADLHGNFNSLQTVGKNGMLRSIPTNLTGEPGGVGYLEYFRAKGYDDKQIIDEFQNTLSAKNEFAIVYGHPAYCGTKELTIIQNMIQKAIELDYKTATLGELLGSLERK